jgi:hypothetical protein
MRNQRSWLGFGLIALGLGVALCAALGPLWLDEIAYRTSPSALNQIIGSDAAGLFLVAPASIVIGALVLRGRPGAAVLGLGPAVFVAYTTTQLVVGNEYLDRPGNVEKFFPLLLGLFVLASAVAIGSWAASAREPLPEASRRADKVAGIVLVAIAAFVVIGLHLPTYLDALSSRPTNQGYLSSPTAFWLVKFMDLAIVAPAALAVGIGMLVRRPWARRPMYAIVGGYALLGASVAAMAVVMFVTDDPDASLVTVAASVVAALSLVALAGYLYRPVLAHR